MHSRMKLHSERMMHTFLVILHVHHRILIKLAQGLMRHEVGILLLVSAALLSLLIGILIFLVFWLAIIFFVLLFSGLFSCDFTP
jgi:hypothetical protein